MWEQLFALGRCAGTRTQRAAEAVPRSPPPHVIRRLLGFAVFHHESLPAPFSPVLFAMMTGQPLTAAHVRALEPDGRLPGVLETILQEGGLAKLQEFREEVLYMSEEAAHAEGKAPRARWG